MASVFLNDDDYAMISDTINGNDQTEEGSVFGNTDSDDIEPNIIDDLIIQLRNTLDDPNFLIMFCAAHTLQLAVMDSMKLIKRQFDLISNCYSNAMRHRISR